MLVPNEIHTSIVFVIESCRSNCHSWSTTFKIMLTIPFCMPFQTILAKTVVNHWFPVWCLLVLCCLCLQCYFSQRQFSLSGCHTVEDASKDNVKQLFKFQTGNGMKNSTKIMSLNFTPTVLFHKRMELLYDQHQILCSNYGYK